MALYFDLNEEYIGIMVWTYWLHEPESISEIDLDAKLKKGYIKLESANSKVDIVRYFNGNGDRHRLDGPAVDTGHVKMWYINDIHRPDIGKFVKENEMSIPLCDEDLAMILLMFIN